MRDLVGVLASTLSHVFVAPIQEGRPRPSEWPRPLRWIALVATVVILALGLLTAFGVRARSWGTLVSLDNFMIYPEWAISPMLWVGVFVLTLLFSATLRTHWAITLAVWLGVTPQLVMISAAGGVLGTLLAVVAVIVLLIMPWIVRRRPWHVAEVMVVWLLMQVVVLFPLTQSIAQNLGLDARTLSLLNMQLALSALAVPAVTAAGYAAVELVVTTGQWLTHDLRQLGTRSPITRWLLVVVVLTGIWRGVTVGLDMADGGVISEPGTFITTLCVLVVTVGLCLLAWSRSKVISNDRRAVWPLGRPAFLAEVWNPWTFAAGAALMVLLLPTSLFTAMGTILSQSDAPAALTSSIKKLSTWFTTPLVRHGTRVLFGVAVYVVAWRKANAGLALVAAALIALWGMPLVDQIAGGSFAVWDLDNLTGVVSVAALVWFLVSLARRRLHNGVLLGVWVVWLLPQIYQFRGAISDPTALVGLLSPVALVLLGLLWRLVTDGNFLRGTSKNLPRTSRVLLMLANTSLGMMVLAITALAGDTQPFTSFDDWASLGEELIGGPLLLAAMLAPMLISLWTARIDDDRPRVPVPEGMRLPMPVPAAAVAAPVAAPVATPTPTWRPPTDSDDATTVRPAPPRAQGQMGGQTAPGPAPFDHPQA